MKSYFRNTKTNNLIKLQKKGIKPKYSDLHHQMEKLKYQNCEIPQPDVYVSLLFIYYKERYNS